MMLTTLLPKIAQRHALAGLLLGALLPAVCLATDTPFSDPAALALAPAVLGLGFYRIGRSKARLVAELAERRLAQERLQHDACHDRLTGLANRFCLERDIEAIVRAGDAEARPALLLLDLDRFKHVNDSLGHAAGDELLAAIAGRLRHALSPAARIYRLGGDEFVVTVAGRPSPGKVEDVCRTICRLFEAPFTLRGNRVSSGCSIGVTFMEAQDRSMAGLLKRADLALYEAKALAGNSFRVFDAALAAETRLRAGVERALARAVAAGEFRLQYRPVVDVGSRQALAFSAHLCWAHPRRGPIPADRFTAAAERAGLTLALDQLAVREACLAAAGWPAPTEVSVAILGNRFKDRAFVDFVKACLAESGLAPQRLTIALREAAFCGEDLLVRGNLAELRRHGVRVALGDFGVGFPALDTLRALPVDELRLAPCFASAMMENGRDADLIEILLKLGRTLQVATTVTGVETEAQLDFLRRCGAARVEGPLLVAPLPEAERPVRLSA